MPEIDLLEPVLGGLRETHYFNGRVLTAEDLRREQDADRGRFRMLARAVGDGVVHGLNVQSGQKKLTVTVARGLAVNRDGDPVEVPKLVTLHLVPAESTTDDGTGAFHLCHRPTSQVELTEAGFYVLTVRPASAYSRERVPGVHVTQAHSGCGSRWLEGGAAFALGRLPISNAEGTFGEVLLDAAADIEKKMQAAGASDLDEALVRLRSAAAWYCAVGDDPPGRLEPLTPLAAGEMAREGAGLADPIAEMRAQEELDDCEVPLALLFLTARGIEWIDEWAVRRPPVPRPTSPALGLLTNWHARATATAMALQFRRQMLEDSNQKIRLSWLACLPPVGFVRADPGKTPDIPFLSTGSVLPEKPILGSAVFKKPGLTPTLQTEPTSPLKTHTNGPTLSVNTASLVPVQNVVMVEGSDPWEYVPWLYEQSLMLPHAPLGEYAGDDPPPLFALTIYEEQKLAFFRRLPPAQHLETISDAEGGVS